MTRPCGCRPVVASWWLVVVLDLDALADPGLAGWSLLVLETGKPSPGGDRLGLECTVSGREMRLRRSLDERTD